MNEKLRRATERFAESSQYGFLFKMTALALALALVVLGAGVAFADSVYNDLDTTVDANLEATTFAAGVTTPKDVTLSLTASSPTEADPQGGCNLGGNANDASLWQGDKTGTSALKLTATSSLPSVATVTSPAAFTACASQPGYQQTMTVTPVGPGTTTVTFEIDSSASKWRINSNTTLSTASFTVTVSAPSDTTPPDTTITGKPALIDGDSTPAFSFTSTETGSTFQCRVDPASAATPWTACTSGASLAVLADGQHTFEVRATDAANNTDLSPDSWTWTVDTTPPDTEITDNPAALDNDSTPAFSFTSTQDGSTFQCRVDFDTETSLPAWSSCTSGSSLAALSDGEHTFEVRATDPAGNTDASPDSWTWTIDTAAPDTTIQTEPAALSSDSTPSFTFISTEDNSTFQCRIDFETGVSEPAWELCASGDSFSLGDGTHLFEVRAIDPAGNADESPDSSTFAIDTVGPDVTLSDPTTPTNDTTPSFSGEAESGDGDVTLKLWNPTSDPATDDADVTVTTTVDSEGDYAKTLTTALSGGDGTYTVQAFQTDAAGNTGQSSAKTFVLDTTAPVVTISTVSDADVITPTETGTDVTWSADESGTYRVLVGTGCSDSAAVVAAGPTAYAASTTSTPNEITTTVAASKLAYGSNSVYVCVADAATNTGSDSEAVGKRATTSILYTGSQIVYTGTTGATFVVKAQLSSSNAACTVSGKTLSFSLDDDPTLSGTQPWTGDATTNSSGVAERPLTGPFIAGLYEAQVSFAGTDECAPSSDGSSVTVASPGDSASGGGWYTLPNTSSGSGRVNFGFTVNKVPNTTNVYKGQILVMNQGKWRLKGTLDTYVKNTTSGAASGSGNLFKWNATTLAWDLHSSVTYTINVTDGGSGGKKAATADKFGIKINSSTPTLPNSAPVDLKGGDIKVN